MYRILIVEDDALIGGSIVKGLRETGFEVDWVADGYAAIKQLVAHDYGAVILDLIIHNGLNGFGVLNFIELEQPHVVSRVFLITGMSEQTVIRTAPQLLARLYHKPFDQRKLIEDIAAFVRWAPRPKEPEGTPRVLVVDDDASSAALIAAMTQQLGCAVDVASNGRQAIAKLAETTFNAMVLDLVMPEIDGFSVLEFLRDSRPEAVRCTIVLSGLPGRYRRDLDKYAIHASLDKPVDAGKFRVALDECVGRRRA